MSTIQWSLVFDVILPLAGVVGVIVVLLSPANNASSRHYEWPGDERGEPFRED
jgi:hypothetical protein